LVDVFDWLCGVHCSVIYAKLYDMAKQVGIIGIEGTLGDLTFYKREGKALVKRKSSVSKERIYRDPVFARTRENMLEFGGCSTVAKTLRVGLSGVSRLMVGADVCGRLNKTMKLINSASSGIRGKREIAISEHGSFLVGFEFNSRYRFDSMFQAPFTVVQNDRRTEMQIVIPPFHCADCIHAPSGASHFRLVCAVVALSDYAYDADFKKYLPRNTEVDGLRKAIGSNALALDSVIGDIRIACALEGVSFLPSGCSLIGVVGIEFMQQVDGNMYALRGSSGMMVVAAG